MSNEAVWLVTDCTCMRDKSHAIDIEPGKQRNAVALKIQDGYSVYVSRLLSEPSGSGSNEKWWKKNSEEARPVDSTCGTDLREGMACPSCLLGELQYNGLFQLICDNCGRVAEAAVFT